MTNGSALLGLAASIAFGGLVACSAAPADGSASQDQMATAAASKDAQATGRAAGSSGSSSTSDAGAEPVGVDGGPGSITRPSSASVTVDGKRCTFTSSNVGLDMGLDGHGWTIHAMTGAGCDGFILEVSGVDDVAYPQNGATTFLDQPTVSLFTDEDTNEGRTYLSSPGGSAALTSGPKRHVAATVNGTAHVVEENGAREHDVTFEFAF
jgi:hypothetical protein